MAKLSKVVGVKTIEFEDVTRTTSNIIIHYKQEHTYRLDCGHGQHEIVRIGTRPKSKMKCKTCAKASE